MSSVEVATASKFHVSLNVSDLDKSVRFLTVLFGSGPKKRHADYAKFEPHELPLVLSLEPRRAGSAVQGTGGLGSLNHLGFRLSDSGALVEVQQRLEAAGISTICEEGVECCYARQTKFWVRDPDANLWEIYVLEGDIDRRGLGQDRLDVVDADPGCLSSPAAPEKPVAAPITWAHQLDEEFPGQLEHDSLDEVYLQGTFNSERFARSTSDLLGRAYGGLRPGGKLTIHVLSTNRPLDAAPALPGLASVVTSVPVDERLMADVQAAGFVAARLSKFADCPCFVHEGIEMRETELVAWKRSPDGPGGDCTVLYKGPFTQVRDERGLIFPRGQRVRVNAATRRRLEQTAAGQFAFLAETVDGAATDCDA
jgi:catechol 2,3-dioxygenase-like lactoylglutathione lyase family enzyme